MGLFKTLFRRSVDQLYAHVAGNLVPISKVPDPAISQGMLGNGVAIIPTEGKVYAPCDATVDTVFEAGHAVSLNAFNGAEILIHVGLDTAALKGKYFTVHCKSGDHVKHGDLLIEFDNKAILAEGYNTITPMLIFNSGNYSVFNTKTGKSVTAADAVIELAK